MIILLTFLYLLSILGASRFMHEAYSSYGIWHCLDAGAETIVMIICPIVNSMFAIGWLLGEPRRKNLF